MKTMPCSEDCISYVICRQVILDNIHFPITCLRNKCELFDNFINGKAYGLIYQILEECFKLVFLKIIEKQNNFKKMKQIIEKGNKLNENTIFEKENYPNENSL